MQLISWSEYSETFRDYPGVREIREAAETDLDKALLLSLGFKHS